MNQNRIKVVAIGGGTGLSVLLEGIKKYPFQISAIVTMTDNGSSTGRLRADYGILPPGDIRKCIIALACEKNLMSKLFEFRFRRGKGLSGHSLGNLLMLALEKNTGSFKKAIEEASKILAIKGKVIPATYDCINITSLHKSGQHVFGEMAVSKTGKFDPIEKIDLDKKNVKANSEAIKAIKLANVILIGPGSLYTSIISNFVIQGITNAVKKNKRAQKIFICNVSTERGETQGYDIEDHLRALKIHSYNKIVDYCLINNKLISKSFKEHKLGEVKNITTSKKEILQTRIIKKNIINDHDPLYHDSSKLGKAIWEIINARK